MSSKDNLPDIQSNENIDQQDPEDARQDIGSANSFNKRNSMQDNSMSGGKGPTTGKTAFVAKKERQDVERDAQLLANRIALLKQEEVKTWKKIEETKKRASEVFKLKQRNNEKVQAKMEKMQYDAMIAQQSKNRIE